MIGGAVLVLDIGKSNSKLTLWSEEGRLLETYSRANRTVFRAGYAALDTEGLENWLEGALKEMARRAAIGAIVPIAHGAAAALIADNRLLAPPLCYEDDPGAASASAYSALRDPFEATGSPRLPAGLNLGAQLYRLRSMLPEARARGAQLLTWPQYWAWLLCGVAASELSSLGCHTDLWRPYERRFSNLAINRGWADLCAPVRGASEVLSEITSDWARRTGLAKTCVALCGAHDSNAAFYGARARPQLAKRDVTVVSTGTWFVAMRAPQLGASPVVLSERRDTLMNVDVEGKNAPSARFMGGREVELLIGGEGSPLRTLEFVRSVAPKHVGEVIDRRIMISPTFTPGVGAFPHAAGRWRSEIEDGGARRAAVGLYLALVADVSLDLIGARDAILVEGRFADDVCFVRALAALRPDAEIYTVASDDGLAFGALRLVRPDLRANAPLTRVEPLSEDIAAYAARWRELARQLEPAA